MAPEPVDAAILAALNLDGAVSTLSPFGSSAFSTSYRLDTVVDGEERVFFVKTGGGPEAADMFQGEHYSLNYIATIVPTFCPRSLAFGPLHEYDGHFIVTDFLHFNTGIPTSGPTLAQKLATLHSTPAPMDESFGGVPMYGFPVPTCCGCTIQNNTYNASWADFFANSRLRAIAQECVRKQGDDEDLVQAVDVIAHIVVPRLLGSDILQGVQPVVLHGDLWSGNYGEGVLHGQSEEVVYDAASVFGHSEYDLAIMKMFGGFGQDFWNEYQSQVPPHEPQGEFDDRLRLYQLYHYLNHYAMFGGGYRAQAWSIMQNLTAKFCQF